MEAKSIYVEAEKRRLERGLINWGIPRHMHEGIISYVIYGRQTGDFLRMVFSNDLLGALRHADDLNRAQINAYGEVLLTLPMGCHGSPGRYQEWIAGGGLRGVMEGEGDE